MKFLLTNDDGYDAPGLAMLRSVVSGDESVVVAPLEHQSGCSHRVAQYGESLDVQEQAADVFSVNSTTGDCARLGVSTLAPDVDWVLSGINDGGNVGHDIYLSGTVAGAREAVFMGKPAIAFSQFYRVGMETNWDRAGQWTRRVLDMILAETPEPGTFWNVNFPRLEDDAPEPEVVHCAPCTMGFPVKYQAEGQRYTYAGVYAERMATPGHDVDVCFSGNIAVSRISI